MPRPRLYLHAGLHKTGTSAVQAFAARHRAALRARGLVYPRLRADELDGKESHNRFAHAVAAAGRDDPQQTAARRVEGMVEAWRGQAGDGSVLISAEALCRHVDAGAGGDWARQRRAYLERIASSLSAFEVEAVIVLRRQADFVHSAYVENIMKGTRRAALTFPEFREFLAARHLRYLDNLEMFERCFDRLHVMVYEDLRRGPDFCAAFLAGLGIDARGLDEPGLVRRSLTPRQARAKRWLRPLAFSRGQNRRLNRLLRSGPVNRLLQRAVDEPGTGFWESAEARREWQRRYDAENERIRQRYLPQRTGLYRGDD